MLKHFTVIILLLSSTLVKAESIEKYFKSDIYQCAKKPHIMEVSIIGDTDSSITIERIFKRIDRTHYDTLAKWQLKADEITDTVTVNQKNGKPQYTFSGLLTESPKMVVLDRKGNARTDCSLVLSPITSPTKRYEDVFSQLTNKTPTPSDALKLFNDTSELPPKQLLPSLKQVSFTKKLKEDSKLFWKEYQSFSLEAAEDTKNTSIIEGIGKLLYTQKNHSLFNWHNDLLISAQNKRAIALFNNAKSPTEMRIIDQSQFCTRLEHKIKIYDWRTYLETLSGLPVEFWTTDIAEDYLESAMNCEKPDNFTKTVSKHWPTIEAQNQAFKQLVALRDEIGSMEVTLDTIIEKKWFKVDHNSFNKKGIPQKETTAFLADAIEKQTTIALTKIPMELSEKIDLELPFEEYQSFCQKQRQEIGRNNFSQLQKDIFTKCEDVVADLFKNRVVKKIHTTRDEFLARKGTREDLIDTQGYNLRKDLPKLNFYGGSFKKAGDVITAEITNSESQLESAYQKALKSSIEEISLAFTNAEPFTDSEKIPENLCKEFTENNSLFSRNDRLKPIQSLCTKLNKEFSVKKEVVACDRVWESFEAPDDIQQGTLAFPTFLGNSEPVNIRELMCDAKKRNIDLSIELEKGFFSKDYKLARKATISGVDVKFSVNLIKPEKGLNEWKVADPEITPKTYLDIKKLNSNNSNDLMKCLIAIENCKAQ